MIGHSSPQRDQQRQVFSSSLNGFSTTLAAMLALLGAPYLNELTAPYVVALARRSYGPELVDLVEIAWMIACFPFVFFAARASVGVALMMAGSALAYRLL